MTWICVVILFLISASLLGVNIFWQRSRFFSFHAFFVLWYWIVMFSGIIATYVLWAQFDFLRIDESLIIKSEIYSIFFLITYLAFHKLIPKSVKIAFFPKLSRFEASLLPTVLLIASIAAILYFFSKNGLLVLKSASYEERYESNLGLGIITRLFPLFIAGLVLSFLIQPTRQVWIRNLLLGTIIGLTTYIVMGGYRQIVAIHIFVFLMLGYHYSIVRFSTIIKAGIIGVPTMMLLALMRYSMSASETSIFNFLVFSMDTFSPYDSFLKIIEYYSTEHAEFQGIDIIINEFASLIPRLLWNEKPDLVLNAGNFYTQVILQYPADVTISPTLLGSFFIMNGPSAIFLGALSTAVLLRVLDDNLYKFAKQPANIHTYLNVTFYYAVIFYVLTIAREGLEVFLQRIIMYYIILLFIVLLVKLIAITYQNFVTTK